MIPRERWLCLDMTEKLFTGTLCLNTNKQTYGNIVYKVYEFISCTYTNIYTVSLNIRATSWEHLVVLSYMQKQHCTLTMYLLSVFVFSV